MTTAVLMSDIHGNLTALETVAGSLPPCDAVYVAGDLCFEGPQPAEVVDFLRHQGWHVLMGNTDRWIVREEDGGSEMRAQRIAWTRERLGEERLRWLGELPFEFRFSERGKERLLVVHANPREMDTLLLPTMSPEELRPFFQGVKAEIVAFGHLHTPYLRPLDGVLLANISSVGIPKDLDRRAAYTVVRWEGDRRSVEQVRIPYDLERTAELFRASGMPGAEDQLGLLLRASYD